jgi:hypothetical protein
LLILIGILIGMLISAALLPLWRNWFHGPKMPLDGFREYLETRWTPSERIVITCSAAGALAGVISFGLLIWPLLPLALLISIRLVGRWNWLGPWYSVERRRRSLRYFYVAAVIPLLVLPFAQLWLLIPYTLLSPMGLVYAHLHPWATPRAQEQFLSPFVGVAMLALFTWLYSGPLCRGLMHLTGTRARALAWQLATWIGLLFVVDGLVRAWSNSQGESTLKMIVLWALTIFLAKQAGSVVGEWLARSSVTGAIAQ